MAVATAKSPRSEYASRARDAVGEVRRVQVREVDAEDPALQLLEVVAVGLRVGVLPEGVQVGDRVAGGLVDRVAVRAR
jgi:hypothetical protein